MTDSTSLEVQAADHRYWTLMKEQVETYIAKSSIVPSAYRGKTADIIVAGLAGRAFGWDVITSLNNYHVIEGKASLRPEAMLALVRRSGHSVTIRMFDGEGGRCAEVKGKRADNGDEHTSTFSLEDARRAGLIGKKNWQQYVDAMLTWRAVSALCRFLFPDVVQGAGYVPEELGQSVEVYEDPLADPPIAVNDAKRTLLSACSGDKDLARIIWTSMRTSEDATILQSELDEMIERATTQEIEDAEIVDEEELPMLAELPIE